MKFSHLAKFAEFCEILDFTSPPATYTLPMTGDSITVQLKTGRHEYGEWAVAANPEDKHTVGMLYVRDDSDGLLCLMYGSFEDMPDYAKNAIGDPI